MEEQVITPDINFVNEIIASGGGDLKKCYQCSTCTVICNLSPDSRPFPRKEMIYAQWGLKDKLISNPDIWLCHQCSDCTAYCPRGAKPGEVMGAIRAIAIKNYSPTPFAKMANNPKYLLLLFAIPIIIFLSYIIPKGYLDISSIPRGENGQIVYSKFMPVFPEIDVTFGAAALFAVVCFIVGIRRYWADMNRNFGTPKEVSLVKAIKDTIMDILSHRRFKKCNVAKDRSVSHMLVFYSFVGLAITTTLALIYLYGLKWESPYPLYDPLKIIGNISGIALIIGISLVAYNRMKNAQKAGKGSYFDWLFIFVILGIALTGMGAQLFRLANIAILAYPVYFMHLVFVFFLFAYAPFSKMAHMVYRTTAMVFARYSKREN